MQGGEVHQWYPRLPNKQVTGTTATCLKGLHVHTRLHQGLYIVLSFIVFSFQMQEIMEFFKTKVHRRATYYCYRVSKITENRLLILCIEEQFEAGLSSMYIFKDSQSSLGECIYIRALCSKSSFGYKML